MKRFVQVLSGPSKVQKTDNDTRFTQSTETTESTNLLINTSKLKYLFNEFYKIVSLEKNKLSASCQNCSKIVNGSINSSGNFLSHYKYKHASIMSKVEESRKNNLMDKDKFTNTKQTKLLDIHSKAITKQKINDLVFEYIISEMRPLVTCEKPSFRNLILGLTQSKDETILPNRKQISKQLTENYNAYVLMLTDLIEKQNYICTTADIWSGNNKSYMGMTCHFIDSESYLRKSFVLGCKRIKGSHNYFNIAEVMTEITQNFSIHYSKITHTVTDNASNFGKSFRTFSIDSSFQSESTSVGDLNENNSDYDNSDLEIDTMEIMDVEKDKIRFSHGRHIYLK